MSQPLSPAAQAVLDAAHKATQDPRWQTNFYSSYAAAVIRAAADQLFKTEILPPGYAYSAPAEAWHYEFLLDAYRKLRSIAAELDK